MVNTIYLLSFVETPRKFIIAIINLRGVSTKLNKYNKITLFFRDWRALQSCVWFTVYFESLVYAQTY